MTQSGSWKRQLFHIKWRGKEDLEELGGIFPAFLVHSVGMWQCWAASLIPHELLASPDPVPCPQSNVTDSKHPRQLPALPRCSFGPPKAFLIHVFHGKIHRFLFLISISSSDFVIFCSFSFFSWIFVAGCSILPVLSRKG